LKAIELLLPRPRVCREIGEFWTPVAPVRVVCDGHGEVVERAVDSLMAELAVAGVASERIVDAAVELTGPNSAGVGLRIDAAASSHADGYRLVVSAEGVRIRAPRAIGLAYGVATLRQWLRLHREADESQALVVPGLEVDDRPDFPHRGVLLDISRNRVPKMDTLLALVDRLADWKINQLQLYMEHTFAYRGHEALWAGSDPLTAEDVRQLDRYCAERGIELVPNQNSFGHLHRWLVHEPYRALAECPEGVEHPFSDQVEPFSLCAEDPGSLALLADLYDQLLPCFSSGQFNVGLDETFDLGQGRSAAACREIGRERVYLRYLHKVHRLVAERGRRMQFWGDIILEHPELIPELPEDAVALAWGYEADHPFAETTRHFAAAGLEFYVCPGTSGWSSFAGRTDNALANLANAAGNGVAQGASGLLVTDWGDHGHLQPLATSWPGFAAGAALAWNAGDGGRVVDDPDLVPAWLDRHVFDDRAGRAGRALCDLGNAYRQVGALPANGSALFFLLVFVARGLGQSRLDGLTAEGLVAAATTVERVRAELGAVRMAAPDAEISSAELFWMADVLGLAARLGEAWLGAGTDASLAAIPATERRSLSAELHRCVEGLRELWLARDRPGGLEASATRLLAADRWLSQE